MISILRAAIEDAVELLKIKIEAFQEDVDLYGFGPPGYDSLDNQVKAIENGLYYKILDEGKIIGGMCIYDKGEGTYWLGSIYLHPLHQNCGIGTVAVRILEKEFPQAVKWRLDTPYQSYRNHHFYNKMGFVKVGQTQPDPENNGFHLFLYER